MNDEKLIEKLKEKLEVYEFEEAEARKIYREAIEQQQEAKSDADWCNHKVITARNMLRLLGVKI
ncbi:hypothetical protein [Enterococcus cecorum]|uniref:hypothetical protein n=1 Tax=Enterococcus cecorum TaxID=44008 RepID=UPI00148B68DA|nr:hypothetical protein [Enterococcus cecorum]